MNEEKIAEINYEQYNPKNIVIWDKYIEIGSERRELEKAIVDGNTPYLIESEKGQGKTLLVHTICKENNIALVTEPVGSGTSKYDLIGNREINRDGTVFNLGLLPRAVCVANKFKHALLYGDEANAQDHDIQRWWNSICDGRASVVANGVTYRLNEGCKLSIVWTINPITYAGINTMTEDLRSRFIGEAWAYPSSKDIEKVIDWENIPVESIKTPLLRFVQDVYAMRVKGEVEYALSIRDIAQFVNHYRTRYRNSFGDSLTPSIDSTTLKNTIKQVFLIKYSDPSEREFIRIRASDTFGVGV
tara:strand:+ start:8520 stop:9425 length:906 start_codon:yes stop_codon:yes gene_type:complete